MKAIITALALVTLMSVPTFAQPAWNHTYNQSPASPNYGDNGY
jgi:hypothetical protein